MWYAYIIGNVHTQVIEAENSVTLTYHRVGRLYL